MSDAHAALLQFLDPTQPLPAKVITPFRVDGIDLQFYCRQIPLSVAVPLFSSGAIAKGAEWGVQVLAEALVKPDGTPLRTAAEWSEFISMGHHGTVKLLLNAVMPIVGAGVAVEPDAAVELGNASTPTA